MTTPSQGAPARTSIRLRRNPRWLAVGVLLTVLGGLATAFGFLTVSASESVVVLNRTVHRGEAVTASDLGVVAVGHGDALRTVPAADAGGLVGQRATTDLPAGSLLVEGSLGAPDLAAGQARVGVRLTAGRLPSTGLLPGTPVLAVALADAAAGAGAGEAELPASVLATVVDSPQVQPDGSVVLDLNLPADRAEAVARLAAADRVALVRREGGS